MPDRRPKREVAQGEHAAKTCATCGRTMEWRKAWAKNWDEVKFCSDSCRRHRVGDVDRALEERIMTLLRERGAARRSARAKRRVQ